MTVDTQSKKSEDLPYWLVLNRLAGFGPKAMASLIRHFGNVSNAFQGYSPTSELQNWLGSFLKIIKFDWVGVELDLKWLQSSNSHHIFTLDDSHYPFLLQSIVSAPSVLFVKGEPKWLSMPQIAMVGSRHPTSMGKEYAYDFGRQLAQHGLTVTSGLALGIDGASHQGALDANGGTIAVLGHGLDTLYPRAHSVIAGRIIEQGALISEFPIGAPPQRQNFPRRNRIISGLSGGVLVVEAALKSGSLITAEYAIEQGREVFALPGSVHNPTAKGCHKLIRQGAHLIETIDEIISLLTPFYSGWQPEQNQKVKSDVQHKKEAKETEHTLLAAIGECLTPIDVLIQRTGLPLQSLTTKLLNLEREGQVKALSGGYLRIATGG